jgi:hypothetical protein
MKDQSRPPFQDAFGPDLLASMDAARDLLITGVARNGAPGQVSVVYRAPIKPVFGAMISYGTWFWWVGGITLASLAVAVLVYLLGRGARAGGAHRQVVPASQT